MYTPGANILFAEDDASLSAILKETLEQEGHKVFICADGLSAVETFGLHNVDLCLLDIMLPKMDGYSVAKKIRKQNDRVPIIFLTTKSQETDKLKGYDIGADDYLSKPFSVQELLRKIDVFLKRSRKIFADRFEEIKIGQLVFFPSDLRLKTPLRNIDFTQKEADILIFFHQHLGKTVQRKELLMEIWGKDDYFLGRSLDVFISKLRKYLKDDPSVALETIHGVGFRLNILPLDSR